ncbi:MAG: LLM class F420-dependent oxidoreductase [Pseudonocardia sp.]|nr:LLM class F420-dependent oxidoreductase [Pseudonocardia sp.]
MHPLRFGLKLSQAATIDTLTAVWRIADDSGFDHCWDMDHFASLGGDDALDIFEAWTLLAGMAARTSRTRIGCSVTGNTYRHPAVLAKAAVTVDHLSGGRLEFGIGAGWAENEHTMLGLPFGTARDRADRLEEALPIIRSLWTEARTTSAGKHYRLVDAVAEPKPVQTPHPPIWIGGTGRRRTLRMAAEHAAVWNAPGGRPEQVAELSAVLDGHCAAIGRDPAEIRRSVQIRVPADVSALAEQVRGFIAVGVTEIILIVAADPVGQAERVAALLPDLRALA